MTLSPGTKLGRYEVVEAIGAGDMGEVYRARDTKLKRDDYIYFSSTGGRGISRISAEGGEPEALTEPASGTGTHIHPEVLPNARAILYVVLGPDNQPSHIEAFSLDNGESKLLVREATMPRVSPTGHLVFEQNRI